MPNVFSPGRCCDLFEDECVVEWLVRPAVVTGGTVLSGQGIRDIHDPVTEEVVTDYGIITEIEAIDALPDVLTEFEALHAIIEALPEDDPHGWDWSQLADHLNVLAAGLDAGDPQQAALQDQLALVEADFRDADPLYPAFATDVDDLVPRFNQVVADINVAVYQYSLLARVVPSSRLTALSPQLAVLTGDVQSLATAWQALNTSAAAITAAQAASDQLLSDAEAMLAAWQTARSAVTAIDTGIDDFRTIGMAVESTMIDWDGVRVDDDVSVLAGGAADLSNIDGPKQNWETRIHHNDWPTQSLSPAALPILFIAHTWFTRERLEPVPDEETIVWETLTKGVQLQTLASFYSIGEHASSWSTHSYDSAPVPAELPKITITLPAGDLEYSVRSYRIRCPDAPLHDCPLTHQRYRVSSLVVTQTLDDRFDIDLINNGYCEGMANFTGTHVGAAGNATVGAAPMDEHYWWSVMLQARVTAAAFVGTYSYFSDIYPDYTREESGHAPFVPECGHIPGTVKETLPVMLAGNGVHTEASSSDSYSGAIMLEPGYPTSSPLVYCKPADKELPTGWTRSKQLPATDHTDSNHGSFQITASLAMSWEQDSVPV